MADEEKDRFDLDVDGGVDDVVLVCRDGDMFRLEMMSANDVWIKLYRKGADGKDRDVTFRIGSKKKLTIHCDELVGGMVNDLPATIPEWRRDVSAAEESGEPISEETLERWRTE